MLIVQKYWSHGKIWFCFQFQTENCTDRGCVLVVESCGCAYLLRVGARRQNQTICMSMCLKASMPNFHGRGPRPTWGFASWHHESRFDTHLVVSCCFCFFGRGRNLLQKWHLTALSLRQYFTNERKFCWCLRQAVALLVIACWAHVIGTLVQCTAGETTCSFLSFCCHISTNQSFFGSFTLSWAAAIWNWDKARGICWQWPVIWHLTSPAVKPTSTFGQSVIQFVQNWLKSWKGKTQTSWCKQKWPTLTRATSG